MDSSETKPVPAVDRYRKLTAFEMADLTFCHRNKTNVNHFFGSSWEFSWGYRGSGPSDFSYNILFHFSGGDNEFARNYTNDFTDEVIAHLVKPEGGILLEGEIKAEKILNWIIEKKKGPPKYWPINMKQNWKDGTRCYSTLQEFYDRNRDRKKHQLEQYERMHRPRPEKTFIEELKWLFGMEA